MKCLTFNDLPSPVNAFRHFHSMSRIQSAVNNDALVLLLFLSFFAALSLALPIDRLWNVAVVILCCSYFTHAVSSCLSMPRRVAEMSEQRRRNREHERNEWKRFGPVIKWVKGGAWKITVLSFKHFMLTFRPYPFSSSREKNRDQESQFISEYTPCEWS